MNTRRLNVKRLKEVCPMIAEGMKCGDVLKKANIHPTQYYRYKDVYCEKYKELL